MKETGHTCVPPTGLYRLAACLLVATLILSACAPAAFDPALVSAELQSVLDKSVLDRSGQVYRNALLLVDAPNVDYTFSGAAGLARVDTRETLTPDRQFIVASVAKAMTAVVIHQLAEEGAFGPKGIDATLAELQILPLEVLAQLHLIDGVSYGEKLTLRHLLKQTSGLRDAYFDGLDNPVSLMPGTANGAHPDSLVGILAFDPQLGLTPLVQCTLRHLPAGCNPDDYLFRRPWSAWDYAAWQADPQDKMAGLLNFYLAGMNQHALWQPGQGFHYSDTNYILLGLVIEKTTAQSLHHELRRRIFDPLGMSDTYLIGATEPPDQDYAKPMAEVWAWNEPSISGGVDFSFDWGGGGIVSTLADLHTFMRALVNRQLFRQPATLDELLSVPQDVKGLFYASGLIVFPTSHGTVWYMMGSNGTWVEYYPQLDLITAGTFNDFSNLPGQFTLHAQVFQILARHGLSTPMTFLSSQPTLLVMLTSLIWLVLLLVWLVVALRQRARKVAIPHPVRTVRWLSAGSWLANSLLFALIGMTINGNPFEMLFGFSPQVRLLFTVSTILMALFALSLLLLILRLHRRLEGTPFDRAVTLVIAVVMLVYALSMGMLASA